MSEESVVPEAAPLSRDEERVLEAIEAQPLIDRAVAWCGLNSGSANLAGLEAVAAELIPVLSHLPGELEVTPLAPTLQVGADGVSREQANAAGLRLRVRPNAPVQVALTGHSDTVYPRDSAFQQVVRRGDGALNGPGIADMKGGLSVMLGALAAFERHPAASGLGYTVLISPDEETGSLASAPLLREIGEAAHLHMTYEPAMDAAGTLAAARKGSGNYHLVVTGRAAHAGRDFAAGRNAVVHACRLAERLDGLNGKRDGVTLNVARIDGGAPLNTVPDVAVVRFNVRAPDAEAVAWIDAELRTLLAGPPPEGIGVVLHGAVTRPPKPFTPAQSTLFHGARDVARALGQTLAWKASGGVCEGNNLYAAGCPGIDTLGVCGGSIHSPEEHAWPESFGERARLSTLLLCRIASGEIDARGIRQMAATR